MGYSEGLDCVLCHFKKNWNHHGSRRNICTVCFGYLFVDVQYYGMQDFMRNIQWNTTECEACGQERMCLMEVPVCEYCMDNIADEDADADANEK